MATAKLTEANRRADELFTAFNVKIDELKPRMNELEKLGDFESVEYEVLCAMVGGLIATRDARMAEHDTMMREMAPEWDD